MHQISKLIDSSNKVDFIVLYSTKFDNGILPQWWELLISSFYHFSLLPIVECELVLLSLHPVGKESLSRVLSRPLHDISESVRAEVYVITPDKLNDKIIEMYAAII